MSDQFAPSSIHTHGLYVDVGGLWVRYDTVGTVKEVNPGEGPPYCQVVLTLPGYKTLGVSCKAEELLTALEMLRSRHEYTTGYERAKGMRE